MLIAKSLHSNKRQRGAWSCEERVPPSKCSSEEIKESVSAKSSWKVCKRILYELRHTSEMGYGKCWQKAPWFDAEMHRS